MIALKISIAAAAELAAAAQSPASAQPVDHRAAQQVQCHWEAPAQFDPKTPARPPIWICQAAGQARERCGHYEVYLPIWAVGRALPPVRTWVTENCRAGAPE